MIPKPRTVTLAWLATGLALGQLGCQGQRELASTDHLPGIGEPPTAMMTSEPGARPEPTLPPTEAMTDLPDAHAVIEASQANHSATDLLDDWGWRATAEFQSRPPTQNDHAGAERPEQTLVRNALGANDSKSSTPITVLGERDGIQYGRWTHGPADTLSIEIRLDTVGEDETAGNALEAMIERAAKLWSWRIADTWQPLERYEGELKGRIADEEVRIGPGGEHSTGLEVEITVSDLPGSILGRAHKGEDVTERWEPRFAGIQLDTKTAQRATHTSGFHTIVHELGHVLAAWRGDEEMGDHARYTDHTNGTWTGPNVVALHGRPAPFQSRNRPYTWIHGERPAYTRQYDLRHSGVCTSALAYCRSGAGEPRITPQEIDFAFLADLGMTILDPGTAPETYGLGAWNEDVAWGITVARTVKIHRPSIEPTLSWWDEEWQGLRIFDLFDARVDVVGDRTLGTLQADPLLGTLRYTGALLGTTLGSERLLPVTGQANLEIEPERHVGEAVFSALEVHRRGKPEPFPGGILRYRLSLSDGGIEGTDRGSSLRGDFYGPEYRSVAGTLRDPFAGLLAAFGAGLDERPREETIVQEADYLLGATWRFRTNDAAEEGRGEYACPGKEPCTMRRARHHNAWGPWETTDRVTVTTEIQRHREHTKRHAEQNIGEIRIARHTGKRDDGARGRYSANGHTGTMTHATFGTGFERYNTWYGANAPSSDFGAVWSFAAGSASTTLPPWTASWSGTVLGYQTYSFIGEDPLVRGQARLSFRSEDARINIAFSELETEDGRALDDFGFEDVAARPDGTFERDRPVGSIRGSFFGPDHTESAGVFSYNGPYRSAMSGSFGATLDPAATPVLHAIGTVRLPPGDPTGNYEYDGWGVWAEEAGVRIASARFESTTTTASPGMTIDGTPTGTNPETGSAVWTGMARAFETAERGRPVKGAAQIDVDLESAIADVAITHLDRGHDDLRWTSLPIEDGRFAEISTGASIEGAFYGPAHQAAAGAFRSARLEGVFVATRD